MTAPQWWPNWSGETCVIVASGPSAKEANLESARGRARVIAINTSWKLAPWCDVLYACDAKWWAHNRDAVKKFCGLKLSQDRTAIRHVPDVRHVTCNRKGRGILMDQPGIIGWSANGGFHAINLAAQFGSTKHVLVGFDMRIDLGVHWHGKHPPGLNNPSQKNVDGWRKAIDGVGPQLASLGITVINASPVSALTAYPKMTLEDALA